MKSGEDESEFEEEEIDEFDRGTGGQDHRQELNEEHEEHDDDDDDEDYPDSDESESDEDDEGELGHGEEEEDEFELDMDAHLIEDEGKADKEGQVETDTGEKDQEEEGRNLEAGTEKLLLLLPAPPGNPTLACLQSLYAPPLAAAFQQTPPETYSILDVAVHFPLLSTTTVSRRKIFAKTQRLLARLYSSTYSAAMKEGREDLVDVRIIFLSDTGLSPEQEKETIDGSSFGGPVVSLRKLADSGREWRSIIIASPPPKEGEEDGEGEGEVIAKNFLTYRGDKVGHDTMVLRSDLGDIPEDSEEKEEETDAKIPENGEEHAIVAGISMVSLTVMSNH